MSGRTPFLKNARIHCFTCPRDSLKIELVAGDFDQHERPVSVEAFDSVRRWLEVMKTQFPGVSQDEVVDPIMRLDSLVDMIVPGKNDVDSVFLEDRFEQRSQIRIGTVKPGV